MKHVHIHIGKTKDAEPAFKNGDTVKLVGVYIAPVAGARGDARSLVQVGSTRFEVYNKDLKK